MSAATKPATPLPWHVGKRLDYEESGMRTLRAARSAHVANVWNGGTRQQKDADANAAYIAHAANAYPKLVGALRTATAATRKYPSVPFLAGDEVVEAEIMDAARALLRELGEAE